MKSKIKLINPCFINAITFYKSNDFKSETINEILSKKSLKKDDDKFFIDNKFYLKYNLINEIDYTTLEIYLQSDDVETQIENDIIIDKYLSLNIDFSSLGLEIFSNKNYIICDNFLDLNFVDELLYNIFYKKIDEVRYIFSDIKDNEFILNFLKHIIKFDIYYAKILTFYKKFSLSYPELQKSNFKLIEDYSKIISIDNLKLNQSDLNNLNNKIQNLQALNFALMYDLESLDSNLENLESRLKTIGAEKSRYFLNHIEKAKFIIETFDSVLKKNNLIKDNILQNYLELTKNSIENQKLDNDKKKINHIKNIKELLSGLAFVEIFINGLAESTKIFHFQENIKEILQNTAFMRMSLILLFVVIYFMYYFWKKMFKQKN